MLLELSDVATAALRAWTFDDVCARFAALALYWHDQIDGAHHGARKRATTVGELRDWITTTESLAARMPFNGPVRAGIEAAADRLRRVLESPGQFFSRWPHSLGTQAEYEWRTSVNLWALDQLARGVNSVELDAAGRGWYLAIPFNQFWREMFPGDDAPDFAVYKVAQKRIARLTATIAAPDALMVHLLVSVLHEAAASPATTPK
jgi:hypothetical protein